MRFEPSWNDQWNRVTRLCRLIQAEKSASAVPGLSFEDLVMVTCQSMWHLKDWVLNDPMFLAADLTTLHEDIHSQACLLACADLANRSKHFRLDRPKSDVEGIAFSGIHFEPAKNINREFLSISGPAKSRYHNMDAVVFLTECWEAWNRIINEHYYTREIGPDWRDTQA